MIFYKKLFVDGKVICVEGDSEVGGYVPGEVSEELVYFERMREYNRVFGEFAACLSVPFAGMDYADIVGGDKT